VHFSHYCLQHNSKMNDPKVFKLGVGNVVGISYKWYGFGVAGRRARLRLVDTVNSNMAWVRTL